VAYRSASAVKTGARVRTEETATLPPTQTMAEAPAATPVTVPRREADGTATPVSGPEAGAAEAGRARFGAGPAAVAAAA
jgi:hypothetical protein